MFIEKGQQFELCHNPDAVFRRKCVNFVVGKVQVARTEHVRLSCDCSSQDGLVVEVAKQASRDGRRNHIIIT